MHSTVFTAIARTKCVHFSCACAYCSRQKLCAHLHSQEHPIQGMMVRVCSSLAYKSCMVTPVFPPLQRPPLLPCPSLHHPGQTGRVLEDIDVPLRQHSLSVSIDEGRSPAPPLVCALHCSTSCWGLAEQGSHLLLWVSIFTTRRVPLLPEVLAGWVCATPQHSRPLWRPPGQLSVDRIARHNAIRDVLYTSVCVCVCVCLTVHCVCDLH